MYALGIFLFLSNVNTDPAKTLPLAYAILMVGVLFTAVALYNVRKIRQRKFNKAKYL